MNICHGPQLEAVCAKMKRALGSSERWQILCEVSPGARVTRPLQRAFDDPLNPPNRRDLVSP